MIFVAPGSTSLPAVYHFHFVRKSVTCAVSVPYPVFGTGWDQDDKAYRGIDPFSRQG
jgi:hypothetical protein